MQKKYLHISIISLLFFSSGVFIFAKTSLNDFQKYEKRVERLCKPYESQETPISYGIQEFIALPNNTLSTNSKQVETSATSKPAPDFEDIKTTYLDNMNNIYNCAMLSSQQKTLTLLTQDLLKNDLEIKREVENQLKKIELSAKAFKCTTPKGKNGVLKAQVLKETTYQTCKYHSYLEYSRIYFQDLKNIVSDAQINYNISQVEADIRKKEQLIDDEIERIYTVFPIAYRAYSDYENNITQHYMLQVIKSDYVSLRDNLHNSLNPISQLGYKAINATKSN